MRKKLNPIKRGNKILHYFNFCCFFAQYNQFFILLLKVSFIFKYICTTSFLNFFFSFLVQVYSTRRSRIFRHAERYLFAKKFIFSHQIYASADSSGEHRNDSCLPRAPVGPKLIKSSICKFIVNREIIFIR